MRMKMRMEMKNGNEKWKYLISYIESSIVNKVIRTFFFFYEKTL